MSNSYRGVDTPAGSSGFVGIDEDGLGDGGATSNPASSGLQNRIAGNLLYLAPGVTTCSFAPVVANSDVNLATGDRPWTSLLWSSVGIWTIPGDVGFEGVRLGGVYNCESNSTQNDVRFMACISRAGSIPIQNMNVFTLANTQNASNPDYTTLFATPSDGDVIFDAAGIKSPGEFVLSLWVQGVPSGDSAVTGESASFKWATCEHATDTGFTSGNAFYHQQSANPYDTAAAGVPLESAYLEVTGGFPSGSARYEILAQVNTTNDALLVFPTPGSVSSLTVKLSYLSWLQLRGLWIKPIYRSDSILRQPQKAIEANKTFTSAQVIKHATAIRSLYNRRRLLAVGPQGILDSTSGREEYQGRDYPYRWPFVDGDETPAESGGSSTHTDPNTDYLPLIEQCVFIDGEDPTLVVDCHFIAVVADEYAAHSNFGSAVNPGGSIPVSTKAANYIGEADWDFELKIHQLVNNASPTTTEWWDSSDKTNLVPGATGNSGETWTERLDLYPTSEFAPSATLKTIQTLVNFDASSDLAWANREGQLFLDDHGLLQHMRFAVPLTNMSTATATGRPIRVRLEAALNSVIRWCTGQTTDTAKVRLMLVGFSIWQENDDG
jgi:hypothetical protein